MAKKKDTMMWVAGGVAALIGGLLMFKVLELRPTFPFLGAGDYWQDQPGQGQVYSSPNDAFVQGEMW